MQQRKGKKILIYFFLLLLVGSINNINLNTLELPNINNINIVGLDVEDKSSLYQNIKNFNLNNIFSISKIDLINEIEYFFGEDQGRYLIEISKEDQKKVTDILNKNAVHYDELGTINENQLLISEKTKVSIDELRSYYTNWLTDYMSK